MKTYIFKCIIEPKFILQTIKALPNSHKQFTFFNTIFRECLLTTLNVEKKLLSKNRLLLTTYKNNAFSELLQ